MTEVERGKGAGEGLSGLIWSAKPQKEVGWVSQCARE